VRRLRGLFGYVWLVPVAVAGWELAARRAGAVYYPPPSEIAARMFDLWFSGPAHSLFLTQEARDNLGPGLARLLGSWAIAAVAGVSLGFALGRSARLSGYLDPILQFSRAIPPPTLIPLFLALFRVGTEMQMVTIVFGVLWPVLLNSVDGARHVEPQYLDTARVFTLTRAQRLLRVILPAASPKIFAGLRVSLSLALILMVISEFVGSTDGIGFSLLLTQRNFDIPGMWACIALLGLLGLVLNTALLLAEHRLLGWHHRERRTS
jgi:ABC-type nitrate/sulfonate/bicarbonate transport system permease component